jgi:hypothetical protein
MIDDPDIIRAAKLLIDQRGEYAASCADSRAKELFVRGDIDASALWRQIVAAIEELRQAGR